MKKKIKIIDILCLINCNEEVPKEIIYNCDKYTYNESVQDYYNDNDEGLFEKGFTNLDTHNFLNREVEILDEEDEFEDIEYYDLDNFKYIHRQMKTIIKNQKKIIERLKENE